MGLSIITPTSFEVGGVCVWAWLLAEPVCECVLIGLSVFLFPLVISLAFSLSLPPSSIQQDIYAFMRMVHLTAINCYHYYYYYYCH